MKYIVIELQTASDGTVANLVTAHDTKNAAEAKYHQILSSAAISNVPIHAAVIIDSCGSFVESRCYEHEAE